MSIMSIWSNVSFKANISLLIFCLDDLSKAVNKVLRTPVMTVLLSVSPFSPVSACFIYFGLPDWMDIYTHIHIRIISPYISVSIDIYREREEREKCYVFLMCRPLYHYKMSIFVSCYLCYLVIYLVRYKCGY